MVVELWQLFLPPISFSVEELALPLVSVLLYLEFAVPGLSLEGLFLPLVEEIA